MIKALLGGYFVATDEVRVKKSWQWLKQSGLKKEKEIMIMVTPEETLRTGNTGRVMECVECVKREMVGHIVSSCEKLEQKVF